MNKRINWLDTARGYGMILVIIGHALTTSIRLDSEIALLIYNFIYSFHMPLLLFISGYAFNLSCKRYDDVSASDYLAKKIQKLIIPYISYSLVIFLLFTCLHFSGDALSERLTRSGYGLITFKEWIYELIIGKNTYCQHLWYIYTLFILSIVSFFFLKVFKRNYKYMMLIITLILYLVWPLFIDKEIDILWKTCYRGIWFAVGLIIPLKTIREYISNIHRYCIVSFFLIIACVGCSYGRQFLDNQFLKRLSWIPENLLLILICLLLAQISSKLKSINWIGKNSFGIYLFHQPFFGSGLGVILHGMLGLPIIICVVVSVVFCIVGPLFIVKILNLKIMKMPRKAFLG